MLGFLVREHISISYYFLDSKLGQEKACEVAQSWLAEAWLNEETLFPAMFLGVAQNDNREAPLLGLAEYIDYSGKQFESISK